MQRSARQLIIVGIIVLFVGAILAYSAYQLRNLILGPVITIESPTDGSTLTESLVEIRGVAKNISHLSLNGRPIFIDPEGHFSEKLLVSYGYTIMTILAADRFGRSVEKRLQLMYQ